jgi:excisionase family DNA binding protein
MSVSSTPEVPDIARKDVLTLAEAANYLRVAEEELLRLAEQREVPAKQIGGEWRFLKRALGHWLTYGSRFLKEFPHYPPWIVDSPQLDELLFAIEKRLLQRIDSRVPNPGSKQSIRKHVGVLGQEDDLEAVLESLAAMRAAKPRGSGE